MNSKKYNIVGVMSGTSLDGMDIALCEFELQDEKVISYSIIKAETFEYSDSDIKLLDLMNASALQFAKNDFHFGRLIGEKVHSFLTKNNLSADFVASHGHTIFHQPASGFTTQIGNGSAISAFCGLPVVADFRSMDVALGGQGAPLVPIGDLLLFNNYYYCLNLGGIANISAKTNHEIIAYDICPVNIPLNYFANKLGFAYDKGGEIAKSGKLNLALLDQLNDLDYYKKTAPKSLGKEWVEEQFLPILCSSDANIPDILATLCHHIAGKICEEVKTNDSKMLVTGGGAFNSFLIELMNEKLLNKCQLIVPDAQLVGFKEALIFAFLGLQRILNKPNALKSVTGAEIDNISGALYGDFSKLIIK